MLQSLPDDHIFFRGWPIATFRCDAELGRYRDKPDIEQVAAPSMSLAR